jgi:hypothetical protein
MKTRLPSKSTFLIESLFERDMVPDSISLGILVVVGNRV